MSQPIKPSPASTPEFDAPGAPNEGPRPASLYGQRPVQARRGSLRTSLQASQYRSPPPRTIRREREAFFSCFRSNRPFLDAGQLEGLEDRPDVEQRVDGLRARVESVLPSASADAPPSREPPARAGGLASDARSSSESLLSRLSGRDPLRVATNQRGGQRAQLHRTAGREVMPARRRWSGGRAVRHALESIGLDVIDQGVAVRHRAEPTAGRGAAACLSKVARGTPGAGAAIVARGMGRARQGRRACTGEGEAFGPEGRDVGRRGPISQASAPTAPASPSVWVGEAHVDPAGERGDGRVRPSMGGRPEADRPRSGRGGLGGIGSDSGPDHVAREGAVPIGGVTTRLKMAESASRLQRARG